MAAAGLSAFLPTLLGAALASALASMGGRDQMLVAALADRLGRSSGLLAVAAAVSVFTAALVVAGGARVAALLTPSDAWIAAAFAIGLAAVDLLRPVRAVDMAEPTRSLGAVALVLLSYQMTSAARFVLFALAVRGADPLATGVGGAAGAIAAITAGWWLGNRLSGWPLATVRRASAVGMVAVFVLIGISANNPA